MERRLRKNAEGIRKKARSTRRPSERSERLELFVMRTIYQVGKRRNMSPPSSVPTCSNPNFLYSF